MNSTRIPSLSGVHNPRRLTAVLHRFRSAVRGLSLAVFSVALLAGSPALANGEMPPPPDECEVDEDCGECGVCSSGSCGLGGTFDCDATKPCLPGFFCHVDPCSSICFPVQCPPEALECPQGYEPQDTTADGCVDTCIEVLGPCEELLPECTSNSDCAPGYACDITGCKDSCFCDEQSGQIVCLGDCGSGVCVAQDDESGCPAPQFGGAFDCPSAPVWAQNPLNGDCCEYSTSCEAPSGWPLAYGEMQCLLMAPLDPCVDDSDCMHCFSTCQGGYCQAPETNESECESDADCGPGQACDTAWCGGSCYDVGPNKGKGEVEIPTCFDDSDCAPCFEVCVDSVCMATGGVECESDLDCGPGYACDTTLCEGTCVESGSNPDWPGEEPECETDSDCAPCFEVCVDSVCMATGGVECESDLDCGPGYACDTTLCEGTCVESGSNPDWPGEEPECETDSDCAPCFEACVDGVCMATGGVECESDLDCGPGFACDTTLCEGTCVESGTNPDMPIEEPECETDADCGGCFEICADGACLSTGAPECSTDAECGQGAKCDLSLCEGTCVEKQTTSTPIAPDRVEPESVSGTGAGGCASSQPSQGLPMALWVSGCLLVMAHRRRRSRGASLSGRAS